MKKLLLIILLCSTCFGVSLSLNNFNGGQASPHMETKIFFPKYATLNRTMENMFPTVYGPAVRRPGTYFVAEIPAADGLLPLEPITPDPAKIGITTVAELALIGNDGAYSLNGDYELLNALDMDVAPYNTGTGWPGIGGVLSSGNEFRGTFDGNYFTISNLFIDQTGNGWGLFRSVRTVDASTATVSNLLVTGVDITGDGFVGAMVGQVGSNVAFDPSIFTNCYVSGTVKGATLLLQSGGFAGNVDGTFVRCGSDVVVDATGVGLGTLGGFYGTGSGIFTDCYAAGGIVDPVGFEIDAGGFNSNTDNSDTYVNCYATGLNQIVDQGGPLTNGGFAGGAAAGTITDCFWDTEDTTQPIDYAGATGKTTAQMQYQATFTNWDFTDVWYIDEGTDYPRHQWVRDFATVSPRESSNGIVRLIPFEISTDESYVIEAGNQYFRFYKDDGT